MEPKDVRLVRARRQARALLAAARRGEPDALALFRPDRPPMLADAQRAIARQHGFPSWPRLVKAQSNLGDRLLRAAASGDEDALSELLDAGAPPNWRESGTNRTPLHVASAADQLNAVSVLVGWVPVDQLAVDRDGRTALDVARPGSAVEAVLRSCRNPLTSKLVGRHATQADDAAVALLEQLSRGRGVSRLAVGDGFAFRTGLFDNTRNGVICGRLPDGVELATIVDFVAGVPATWYVPSAPGPDDELRPRLLSLGCTPERTAVHMSADLDSFDNEEGATVVELSDPAELIHLDRAEAQLLASAGRPLRHFVMPGVGGITTFHHGDTTLGVHLRVEREHRRQGHAASLVRHAAAAGRADGSSIFIVEPTPATVPFFERLGFDLARSRPDCWYYLPVDEMR